MNAFRIGSAVVLRTKGLKGDPGYFVSSFAALTNGAAQIVTSKVSFDKSTAKGMTVVDSAIVLPTHGWYAANFKVDAPGSFKLLNNGLAIPGSIFASPSIVMGRVIFSGHKGDKITLVNNTLTPIALKKVAENAVLDVVFYAT